MPLETSETIAGLNPLWPLGSDPKSQGDDHLRLIKAVLQADALTVADQPPMIVLDSGHQYVLQNLETIGIVGLTMATPFTVGVIEAGSGELIRGTASVRLRCENTVTGSAPYNASLGVRGAVQWWNGGAWVKEDTLAPEAVSLATRQSSTAGQTCDWWTVIPFEFSEAEISPGDAEWRIGLGFNSVYSPGKASMTSVTYDWQHLRRRA